MEPESSERNRLNSVDLAPVFSALIIQTSNEAVSNNRMHDHTNTLPPSDDRLMLEYVSLAYSAVHLAIRNTPDGTESLAMIKPSICQMAAKQYPSSIASKIEILNIIEQRVSQYSSLITDTVNQKAGSIELIGTLFCHNCGVTNCQISKEAQAHFLSIFNVARSLMPNSLHDSTARDN